MVGKLRNPSDRSNASTMSMLPGYANKEYFWACDLTSDKPMQKWHTPSDELDEDDEDYVEHTLVVRSVCLGVGAVEKEENIVVMECVGENGEVFKGTIANLTKGINAMVGDLSLTVDGKSGATFTLVEGSGPISVCGNCLLDYPEDDDLDASQTDDSQLDETGECEGETGEDEEEEDDSIIEEKAKPKQQKRKAPVAKASKGKQKPKIDEDEEDEDSEDEEEEEESEEEDVKVKKAKKDAGKAPTTGKGKIKTPQMKNGKPAKKVKK